ncbi:hypothetical protein [Luteimonas kalidii]|uniref:Secreted protein n=1 Tax=Luteimonas kalidii TaxID=3042025 RepID=A0ABT6JSV3_9GAMM|nr:hypothetical protein [Luteimonas kalidii]MDH5833577.1 hypothetical protein [Luteimonas kalidii]
MTVLSRTLLAVGSAAVIACMPLAIGLSDAEAAKRGGAGVRASASGNVNRAAKPRAGNVNRNASANRNINSNRNVDRNRNVNRNVNVDVDIDDRGCCHHDYWDHPVATAAAVTATVAVTSAVIGSIVYSVPPSCGTVVVNGIAYQQCGSTWYQPQYAGTTVQYVVVNPPR